MDWWLGVVSKLVKGFQGFRGQGVVEGLRVGDFM